MKNKIKIFLGLVTVLLIISAIGTSLYIKNETSQKNVVILFTSDVHCGIGENFGYAGLYEVKEKLKNKGYETILVDNGDSIQGDMIGIISQGEDVIDLMNELDYDIATPGNHDFDYGVERFLELSKKAKFQYISCNFNKAGELVFKPYVIKKVGKTKLHSLGLQLQRL